GVIKGRGGKGVIGSAKKQGKKRVKKDGPVVVGVKTTKKHAWMKGITIKKVVDDESEEMGKEDGMDRREGGMDKKEEGMDRMEEGIEGREDGMERSEEGVDKREEGMERREDGMDRQPAPAPPTGGHWHAPLSITHCYPTTHHHHHPSPVSEHDRWTAMQAWMNVARTHVPPHLSAEVLTPSQDVERSIFDACKNDRVMYVEVNREMLEDAWEMFGRGYKEEAGRMGNDKAPVGMVSEMG
ncbi:hypothetical protein HK101_010471, partial [Irineochytrium annulatum]